MPSRAPHRAAGIEEELLALLRACGRVGACTERREADELLVCSLDEEALRALRAGLRFARAQPY